MIYRLATVGLVCALALAGCERPAPPATAQASTAPTAAASAKPPQPDYHPSVGDMMNIGVQPRHIKLGLAGQAKNWVYASYEADELKNAFDRIARTIPDYRGNDLGKMFDGGIKPAIAELKAAAQASDAKAYDGAYAKITEACNSCHQGLDHPMIRIHAPARGVLAYADQDFAAAAK